VVVKENTGSRAAIVAYGSVLDEALKAESLLAREGIEVDVINARFAAPVDGRITELAANGKSVITVEDHSLACGFGSAVLEEAQEKYPAGIKKAIRVLGAPCSFIGHDSRKNQFIRAGINADKIVQAVRQILGVE
jgi:1-deoxy-D-xylulose-5-phosphate synthase